MYWLFSRHSELKSRLNDYFIIYNIIIINYNIIYYKIIVRSVYKYDIQI
jgi:hypothetical protein